jgi:hypothetical protein
MFFSTFTSIATDYKPFWALMAADLGYIVWLERTYGGVPEAGYGGSGG